MREARLRFDNFVVGASNRLAASAALAVARAPGSTYNPLFIYGPSGLGKTHLLTALRHESRTINGKLAAVYLGLEDFIAELEAAIGAGQIEGFRRRFQRLELLLLDDVQFLDGRTEAQSELLRIFVAMQERGGQLVMASDRAPSDLADLDRRLLTRMAGGLVVDIGVPEYETRVAILRNICSERRLSFAPGILEEVARVPTDNVRELHGVLNKLVAQQSALRAPLTLAKARDLLGLLPAPQPPDEFEMFVTEVANVVEKSVEAWRVRLSETIARWAGEGFRTELLARYLENGEIPDLEALESQFVATVNRLRALEAEAARLDPKLAGMPVFRDPARVEEAESIVQRALAAYDPAPAPHAHFTIDRFVVGARNQLAVRAAGEVIALPGSRYNPLYLFGPSGAGKTHLAHAIGNALAARDDGAWTVACVGATEFAEEIIRALQEGSIDRWRLRYRSVDALVLDDVHRLADKAQAHDELFHLFNALHAAGRQIVLTATVPPSGLRELAPRLRSRFEGGLVVELGDVPEAERVARHTPVPAGAEAAAPTIDTWFDSPEPPAPSLTP
ncbi:MAG TPA: DnaA/Hda family protein, partial [Gemmatimonadaceae bacterium]